MLLTCYTHMVTTQLGAPSANHDRVLVTASHIR